MVFPQDEPIQLVLRLVCCGGQTYTLLEGKFKTAQVLIANFFGDRADGLGLFEQQFFCLLDADGNQVLLDAFPKFLFEDGIEINGG